MSKAKRWRIYNRRVLVDPFQLRIVGVAVFHFMLVVLIFAAALFVPVILTLESGDISSPQVQSAAREFLVLHTRLWAPLFGVFAFLVLHNIMVTHRIAGPLYRLRRYLKAVGGGDLSSPIQFRKGDYLKKEAEAASHMVESLRIKIACAEEQLDQANEAWMDVRTSLGDGISGELKQKINALDDRFESCWAHIMAFKTGSERIPSAPRAAEAPEERIELRV